MKEFKIYKQQIPHDLIDSLIDEHRKFKSSPFSIFRAQGSTAFESPCVDKFGNQSNSIHNPHMLGFTKLRAKTLNILHHENISQCLKDFFDKDDEFVHWHHRRICRGGEETVGRRGLDGIDAFASEIGRPTVS